MTTEAPAKPSLNAETLYPLLKRAQELGAPVSVTEPDDDGDIYLKVFDGSGEELINDVIYKNSNFDLNEQYIVMGVLMDWLSRLEREVDCSGCSTTQQEMGRAWATGGFVAMMTAFNKALARYGIDSYAKGLKAKREREAEAAKVTVTLSPEGERIKELEGQLVEQNQELTKLRAVKLVIYNDVEQVDESLGNYVIFLKKRLSVATLLGTFDIRRGQSLTIANDPEAQS